MTIRDLAEDEERQATEGSRGARAAAWAGIVVHLVVGVFPYAFSGLLAPLWAVVTVAVVWFGLLAAAIHFRKRRPWFVAAIPIASLGFWFAFLTFGDLVLGWTA